MQISGPPAFYSLQILQLSLYNCYRARIPVSLPARTGVVLLRTFKKEIMKTQTQNRTVTFSKTATILKCCAIAFIIACAISLAGKISLHEFINNILEWDSI